MPTVERPSILELRTSGPQTPFLAVGLVILVSLVLVGVLLFENQSAKSRMVAEARKDAYHEAMALGDVGGYAIELSDRSLVHFAEHFGYEFRNAEQEKDRLTETLFTWLPKFPPRSNLTYFDSTGRMVASTSALAPKDNGVLAPLFGEESAGALDVVISAMQRRKPGPVVIGRRVRDIGGRFVGVISAAFDFSALDAAQDILVTHKIDRALFVSENGSILASWPSSGLADTSEDTLSALLNGKPNQVLDNSGIRVVDNGAWVLAATSLRNAPLFAVVAISKDRVLEHWRAASWYVYSWVFAIIAGVGILSAVLMLLSSRRHAATEKLFQTLSRAVEASPAMVFICDAGGVVEYVNLKFTEFSGLSFGEATGIRPYFLNGGSLSSEEVDAIRQGLSGGKDWNGVIQIEDRNGNARWVSVMISPVRDSRGRIGNFVGSMEDVTDRIENERRLGRLQKTEALECLVGGISHEFNNLLMPIVGLSEMALNTLSDDSPTRRYLDKILGAGRRAARMIDQIRSFSAPYPPVSEKREVRELVHDLAEKMQSRIPKTISLAVNAPSGIGYVLVDPLQFEMAVAALVSNAVQAMSDTGGTLSIDACTTVPVDSGKPQVMISFTDTGCGMTADIAGKAFDPFFTTREVGEGTGLGLSITRGIVTAHGGSVSIESAPGLGTTVTILLPLVAGGTELAFDDQAIAAQ